MCIALSLLLQNEAPFKPKEDFEIKFNLAFKQRNASDDKSVYMSETRAERDKRTNITPLPYLNLDVKILKAGPEEVKLKVIKDNNQSVFSKKVEAGMEFELELGFTDDIKDKISGFKHVIQFLSSDKKVLSLIVIEFDEEGNYMVNGEKRGKI